MLRAEGPFENDPRGGFLFRMETHHFAMMAISKINRDTIRSTTIYVPEGGEKFPGCVVNDCFVLL